MQHMHLGSAHYLHPLNVGGGGGLWDSETGKIQQRLAQVSDFLIE